MHIAIDAHTVGTNLAGNETYITNLIEALADLDQINRYTLYVTKREAVARFTHRWPHVAVRLTLPHTPLIRIPITLVAELRRRPVDVLHVQYTAPPFAPCPFVATIHDLSFEHLPHTFTRRGRLQLRLSVRRTARRATHLITSSDYSAQQLTAEYKIAPERITVTPLAASPVFAPVTDMAELGRVRAKYKIAGPYLLAVGSIQPRKNLVRLIEAYARLRRALREANAPSLVLVGKQGWLYEETMRAARAVIKDENLFAREGRLIFTGYVPENDLPALYSEALGFVYPSYYEGFGLPILEAMRCGTPVIAGNLTSLPEVVGDAGLLVDPFDVEAIGAAMRRLVDDDELRRALSARGRARAAHFDWRKTARATLDVYERVAARNRSGHRANLAAQNQVNGFSS